MIRSDVIYRAAEELVKKYGTRDPVKIAEELGIVIRYGDGFRKLLGMYTYMLRHRVIIVNSNLDDIEKSLVIAHELGHDALHRELAKTGHADCSLFGSENAAEMEANAFAAHLLIDKEEMDGYMKECGYDPWQTAMALNVNVNLVLVKMIEENKRGGKYDVPYIPDPKFYGSISTSI